MMEHDKGTVSATKQNSQHWLKVRDTEKMAIFAKSEYIMVSIVWKTKLTSSAEETARSNASDSKEMNYWFMN